MCVYSKTVGICYVATFYAKIKKGAYNRTYSSAMSDQRLATDVWSAYDVWSANVHD